MGQDRYWPPFCRAVGSPDLIDDPRFDTPENRYQNREELVDLLDALFLSRTSSEWEKSLQGNADIIWERVQRNLDLPKDPQVVAHGKSYPTAVATPE